MYTNATLKKIKDLSNKAETFMSFELFENIKLISPEATFDFDDMDIRMHINNIEHIRTGKEIFIANYGYIYNRWETIPAKTSDIINYFKELDLFDLKDMLNSTDIEPYFELFDMYYDLKEDELWMKYVFDAHCFTVMKHKDRLLQII